MTLEINMVVSSAAEAGAYYVKLFDAELLSETALESSQNESRLRLGQTVLRVLDENAELGLMAPAEGVPSSLWINLYVKELEALVAHAAKCDCQILSPVTHFPEMQAINAVIKDRFGHIWVLNHIMDEPA